uniref:Uncharacterized protein n=1 Tax=Pseudomonas syringae pv. actinidiae TaxID=103796 RepID=A0A286JZW9_PSESF|nr:hypothetical protein [Pseudomonas syringae pv. actinidiae]
MMAFHIAGWTVGGMQKVAFAVFQRLAFHAPSAYSTSGNDQPFSVPSFDASFALQA